MKRECGENVEKMCKEKVEKIYAEAWTGGLDRRPGQEATVRRTL